MKSLHDRGVKLMMNTNQNLFEGDVKLLLRNILFCQKTSIWNSKADAVLTKPYSEFSAPG